MAVVQPARRQHRPRRATDIVDGFDELTANDIDHGHLTGDGQRQLVFKGVVDTYIGRSLTALHRNPADSWTLEAMARHAGLSRTAFANRFHELMGMTPIQYLTAWRMQIARRNLVETDASIYQVAEQSGYRSEAAFGRVFKRHFDTAPATYRRLQRPEGQVA